MTLHEFKAWLDGFTEGKVTLTESEINLVRQKASEVHELTLPEVPASIYPMLPTYPSYPFYGDKTGDYWPQPIIIF